MTSNSETKTSLSPTKRTLLKIRDLKRQLAEAQQGITGDIAIVSMACRFPRRSYTPEDFWHSLMQGSDEVGEIPDDRWDLEAYYDENPDAPGKMYARKGVFLENLDLMDPDFFGISPREATWVDPQQRLLLEVSWEALERAGWPADKIGHETGLFVGWMHNDYQNESSDSLLNLNPYIATGSAGSFLSGRLSYYLGLEGPSVAIDAACSSSLVALHLACESLNRNECSRAIVGGVNAIVSPTTNILTCKLKALSPAGHSRAFDAKADGYLRGEGCGMVTLRRLADAERDGDPILAVIRGSAVGHNGFSSGLTVPNPNAQERVIRAALGRAGIEATQVEYLEAHGTGTELGDPVEIKAAAAVFGENRDPGHPLLTGSVKTNIGHLEAAAGMAGLIKVLLAFQNDTIPAQLNFEEPNPHIPWDKIPVKVVVEPTAWPGKGRHIAGVSAFGMSGTNAHVVLESPPKNGRVRTRPSSPTSAVTENHLIVLSGKNDEALRDVAERYRRWLADHPKANLADVAHTSGAGRRHFDRRAALVVNSGQQALALLEELERSGSEPDLFEGQQRATPKVAWQFTGQGSQYVGMAKGLYDSQPLFRETLDRCDQLLKEWRNHSLLDVLFRDQELIHHTSWTQPGLFAIQLGLARLLESWGFHPDVVLGHSVGQYAAATVAGILSWEDALRLISERGRLIGALPSGGAMVALFAPAVEVEKAVSSLSDVSLAALNGTHCVISGPEASVENAAKRFAERGIRTKRLTTSHAFHSSLMEPALQPFQEVAEQISFHAAQLPLICNVTGQTLPAAEVLTGEYWRRHIRKPVRYADSINTVKELGCEVLLELGPQPILTGMAASVWGGAPTGLINCLRKKGDDRKSLLSAVAQLYVHGVTPDFDAMDERTDRQRIILPTYPFQRRRFWGPAKPQNYQSEAHTTHPLLGGRKLLAGLPRETRYERWITPDEPDWLKDHKVMDDIVWPGAAYVEMALAAAKSSDLQDVVFQQPLRPAKRTCLQTIVRSDEQEHKSIEVHSLPSASNHWTRHFTAVIAADNTELLSTVDRASIAERCSESIEVADFYQMMQGLGLDYGPQFQAIRSLEYCDTDVLARLDTTTDQRGYLIPPTVLDGAFHALAIGLMRDSEASLFLPVTIERVQCAHAIDGAVWCHATWRQSEGETRAADLSLFDDEGQVVARIENLQLRKLNRAALRQMAGSGTQRLLYELKWRPLRLPPANKKQSQWWVVSQAPDKGSAADTSDNRLAAAVRRTLAEQGQNVVSVELDNQLSDVRFSGGSPKLAGDQPAQWNCLFDHWRETSSVDPPQGIVWVLGDEIDDVDSVAWSSTQRNCSGLLALIAALREQNIKHLERGLQLVTCRGVAPYEPPNQSSAEPSKNGTSHQQNGFGQVTSQQAQYWGLGRAIGAEQPHLRCRLVDVPIDAAESPDAVVTSLVDILMNDSLENQIAIGDGHCLVPRLAAVKLPQQQTQQPTEFSVHADASYLITGGLGMLGRQAGLWLARRGARHVVLVSRRPPSETIQPLIEEIEQLGCRVHIAQADMSERSDVELLVARFGTELPALRGVIHAAGVVDDALLADQSWDRFEKVLAPKVRGAWLLHEFTAEMPLDFFVLYSSAAAVLGNPGQSNYATANAFLDGLAWQRRAAGLPALSVNWGPWTEGMADDEMILKRLALQGITPLTVNESHAALEKMIAADIAQAAVLDVDWRRMRMGLGPDAPPLLEDISPTGAPAHVGDSVLVEKLRKLQGPARERTLVKTIQDELQQILSTPDAPDPNIPLIEMGLDSLMAVEFSTRLQQQLGDGFAIAPTFLFDYPTVNAISDYVQELVGDLTAEKPAEEAPSRTTIPTTRDDVAVIGMSCRFPGASGIEEFWDNLQNGVDAVGEIPADRWDVDTYYDPTPAPAPGKMYTREGGFLDRIGDFDAEFFNISAQEACWTDPQHRLMLEVSWEAMEDAGISTQPLADSRVGVFMGIMSQDYGELLGANDVELIDGFKGAGLAHSAGAGRISYVFGFEGPCIAIDSASSSSLVAVCQAAKSLLEGKCNLALAGGVNAILTATNSLLLCKVKMLSPDGRCKSFSAGADGFGRGEGCGVVILKRLSDAERDGDRVLAVIRGSAVCHNGFSGGLTSPNGRSQERVIREALDDAGILPTQVQYLEAHGTGTELGDPIEIRAAATVLGKGRSPDQPLLVGSVKANIGHLEAAGGISGFIKAVLAMQHDSIPRQLHFDEPSPHVPWERLPLKVVAEPTAWPAGDERIAGVTALGLSGTNAHLILSSPTAVTKPAEMPEDRSHHLLVLSARQESALQQLALRYGRFLKENADVQLADMCHTLAVGRRHFEQRAAFLVESADQASRLLQSLADGEAAPGLHASQARRSPKLAWVFSGCDETPTIAGKTLYEIEPVFHEVIDQCDRAMPDDSRQSLNDWLLRDNEGETTPVQSPGTGTALFALQLGLARLWQSWGVEPDILAGLGVGQYSAACVAGVMKVEDAVKLVAARDDLLSELASDTTQQNGQSAAALLGAFEALADTVDYFPTDRPLICDLSGKVVPVHRLLGGSHWRQHCVEETQFAASLTTLAELKADLIVELGPQPIVDGSVDEHWLESPPNCLPSLVPRQNEIVTMLNSLGELFVSGVTPDFAAFDRPWQRSRIRLPTYPFQRSRYWITDVTQYLEASTQVS